MTMLSLLSLLVIFAFWLREPICWHLLSDSLARPPIHTALGWHGDFRYWHGIALFLLNPVVVLNYGQIGALLLAFIHSCFLIAYLIVCYVVILPFALECAAIAYDNLKQYNRGSLLRHSLYKCRCHIRDLFEGHTTMPHALRFLLGGMLSMGFVLDYLISVFTVGLDCSIRCS